MSMNWTRCAVVVMLACAGTIDDSDGDEATERSASPSAAVASPAPATVGAPSTALPATAAPMAAAAGTAATTVVEPPAGAGAGPVMGSMADPTTPAAAPAPPCDAVTQVFATQCADRGACHVAPGIGDFAAGDAQARALLGKGPILNDVSCGLMIDPVAPERSMILTKVTGAVPFSIDTCKGLMPPGRELSAGQIACIRSWLGQFKP